MKSYIFRNVFGFLVAIAFLMVVSLFVWDISDGALDGRSAVEVSE